MTVLLRALGLQAAYAVLQTFSPAAARAASVVLLLVVNALPVIALVNGQWGAGDVLIAYWLENVAVGVWTLVRILTLKGTDPAGTSITVNGASVQLPAAAARAVVGAFFAVHYGMFTAIHGLFTFMLARRTETTGSVRGFGLMFLALLVSHGVSTAIYWFARGDRTRLGLGPTMKQPYSRIVVLHLSVLGAAWFLVGDHGQPGSAPPNAAATLAPGLLLVAVKVVVDVVAHVRAHREVAEPEPAPLAGARLT